MRGLCLLTLLVCSAGVCAAEDNLVYNGAFNLGLEAWRVHDNTGANVRLVDVDLDGPRKAVRMVVNPPEGAPSWALNLTQPVGYSIPEGHRLQTSAWMRRPDLCRVTFIFEMAQAPHTKYISQQVRLTRDWREYRSMGRAGMHPRPGESQAKFFLGYDAGTVEIAGVRVENYGDAPDTAFDQTVDYWGGREPSDAWWAPAQERIEQIRKGDVTVRVVDALGRDYGRGGHNLLAGLPREA